MSGGLYEQFQKQFLLNMPHDTDYRNLYLLPYERCAMLHMERRKLAVLYNDPFTPEEKSRVLQALAEALHETGLDRYRRSSGANRRKIAERRLPGRRSANKPPLKKKQKWDPDRKKRTPLQAALLRRLPDFSVRINATELRRYYAQGHDESVWRTTIVRDY